MCEFPGKVFKGKKMAGQLGNKSATVLNQRIVRIDDERSLLYIQGAVPGPTGSLIQLRDAVKKADRQYWDLQYPTYVPGAPSEITDKVQTWDGGHIDPMEVYYHENDVVSGPADGGGE